MPFGRIERLVLRSSSGQVRVFRTGLARSHWFFARRVSLIRGKLVKKDLDYSVQRIVVLGADVVNAGQQTFSPESGHSVSFTLAFYALTVRGEDALFGSPAGTRRTAATTGRVDARAQALARPGSRPVASARKLHDQAARWSLPAGPAARALALAGRRGASRDLSRRHRGRRGPARLGSRAAARRTPVPRTARRPSRDGRARRPLQTDPRREAPRTRRRARAGKRSAARTGRRLPGRRTTPPARRHCSPITTSGSRHPHGAGRRSTSRCSGATPATTRR